MNYAGILAGGKGSRMGVTERPKQFMHLGPDAKPIIAHTVEAFLAVPEIDRIIIATPAAWLEYTQVLMAENFAPEQVARIDVIEGGAERSDSLECICAHIERAYGLSESDILVSHDAVRPFVTGRIIAENVAAANKGVCTDTVVAATDTIVVSAGGARIDEIPPRSQFYQGQTPQSFPIVAYRRAFAGLSAEQRAGLTDACKVFLLAGEPVELIAGEYDNIKITTVADLAVAEAILSRNA